MHTVSYVSSRAPSISRLAPATPSVTQTRWLLPTDSPSADFVAVDHPKRDPATITVLMADERGALPEVLKSLLSLANISILGVSDHYPQLLEAASRHRPDVVIISFGLALKTGLERVSRTLTETCGARLLVLTPHTDHAFGEHIAAAGAAGFLHEHACPEQLTSAVRAVHEKSDFFPRGCVHAPLRTACSQRRSVSDRNRSELTAREREILRHIAEGNANKQTASKLGISIKTVEKHRQRLMDKLRIHETATLTRYALYAGIAR